MSRETREWLSQYTLIGFTEKRGNAWHYRAGDNNHYSGPVPIEDVRSRLFNWEPVSVPLRYDYDGRTFETDDQVIIRSDNGSRLGVFGNGYVIHNYDEWLLSNVEAILDDNLKIASAGLLENGAVAWVQVEMPENVTTAEGVVFRPWLNAFGSLNGKYASTYKTGVTAVVCDNTMKAADRENSPTVKIKSTARSFARLASVRESLGLVMSVAEDFEHEVHKLCATDFTDRQFEKLVAQLAPMSEDMKPRGITLAEKKRDKLWDLWTRDERVATWHGTAWGALQADNTYRLHEGSFKGGNRPERNMKLTLSGKIEEDDSETLTKILALA